MRGLAKYVPGSRHRNWNRNRCGNQRRLSVETLAAKSRKWIARPGAPLQIRYRTAMVTGELNCPAWAIDKTTAAPGVTPAGTIAFT